MKEWYGNAWDRWGTSKDWLCITTNLTVIEKGVGNTRRRLVMGAGIAGQAQRFFSVNVGDDIGGDWGHVVDHHWPSINTKRPFVHLDAERRLVMFPVKWFWGNPADLELIERSCMALRMYAKARPQETFLLPRPGCGLGQLSWLRQVRPVCKLFFGDLNNVIIVHNE
jgi:hypothetical protein